MDNPENWRPHEWVGGGILAAIMIALGLQKVINIFKRGNVDGAKTDAEHSLVDALRTDLDRLRADLDEERKARKQMDSLIHEQAIRLTVTQTTLLRVVDLLKQNRINIPKDVQADLALLFQKGVSNG